MGGGMERQWDSGTAGQRDGGTEKGAETGGGAKTTKRGQEQGKVH